MCKLYSKNAIYTVSFGSGHKEQGFTVSIYWEKQTIFSMFLLGVTSSGQINNKQSFFTTVYFS